MATYYTVRYNYHSETHRQNLFMTRLQADRSAAIYSRIHSPYMTDWRSDVATWREREFHWMSEAIDGYTPVPWRYESFWQNNDAIHRDHYAHVSVEDPSMLAFTASEEDGERDRQTRMRPGKYLTKYFSHVLNAKQIAFLAEWFVKGERPVTTGHAELRFARTEEEIVHVYMNGPRSCMGRDAHNNAAAHPTRVYAGDLQVAYLYDASRIDDDKDPIIARALCCERLQAFTRVYPTPDRYGDDGWGSHGEAEGVQLDLLNRLKALGWRWQHEYSEAMNGAKVQKIHRNYGGYVMPYVDWVSLDDEGDHFTLSSGGDYEADRTDGAMFLGGDEDDEDDDDYSTCESCDGRTENTYTVYTDTFTSGQPRARVEWCERCRDNGTFYCDGTNEDFSDSVSCITTADGETYNDAWFTANGGYQCELTRNYHLPDEEPPVQMSNGETWCESEAMHHAWHDATLNRWVPNEDVFDWHVPQDIGAEHPNGELALVA